MMATGTKTKGLVLVHKEASGRKRSSGSRPKRKHQGSREEEDCSVGAGSACAMEANKAEAEESFSLSPVTAAVASQVSIDDESANSSNRRVAGELFNQQRTGEEEEEIQEQKQEQMGRESDVVENKCCWLVAEKCSSSSSLLILEQTEEETRNRKLTSSTESININNKKKGLEKHETSWLKENEYLVRRKRRRTGEETARRQHQSETITMRVQMSNKKKKTRTVSSNSAAATTTTTNATMNSRSRAGCKLARRMRSSRVKVEPAEEEGEQAETTEKTTTKSSAKFDSATLREMAADENGNWLLADESRTRRRHCRWHKQRWSQPNNNNNNNNNHSNNTNERQLSAPICRRLFVTTFPLMLLLLLISLHDHSPTGLMSLAEPKLSHWPFLGAAAAQQQQTILTPSNSAAAAAQLLQAKVATSLPTQGGAATSKTTSSATATVGGGGNGSVALAVSHREIEKQIVDKILGEGYDKRIRPAGSGPYNSSKPGTDGPTIVSVNTLVRSISKIDDVTMEYSVQLSLRQEWTDERLAFGRNPQNRIYGINTITLTEQERLWKPDLFFRNEKEGHFHKIIMPNVLLRISGEGHVLYSIRISLVLACPMDLKYYPLDKQNCTIEMASYGYIDEDLMFVWKKENPVQIAKNLNLPRFTLETYETAYCTSKTSTGSYSCLRIDLIFKREFSYYLIQIYIPCCMLVIVSWVSFWLDPNAIPARVSLGVTTLLTMATQISGINASLPPVSYTKAIDVWTGVCLTFVFGALLEFALVNYASRSDQHKREMLNSALTHTQQMRWREATAAAAAAGVAPPTSPPPDENSPSMLASANGNGQQPAFFGPALLPLSAPHWNCAASAPNSTLAHHHHQQHPRQQQMNVCHHQPITSAPNPLLSEQDQLFNNNNNNNNNTTKHRTHNMRQPAGSGTCTVGGINGGAGKHSHHHITTAQGARTVATVADYSAAAAAASNSNNNCTNTNHNNPAAGGASKGAGVHSSVNSLNNCQARAAGANPMSPNGGIGFAACNNNTAAAAASNNQTKINCALQYLKSPREVHLMPLKQQKRKNWCKMWLAKFPTRSKRIDVISRIFFPLKFALFNLVYWTTYLFREEDTVA